MLKNYELFALILESKKTEEEAKNILDKEDIENSDSIINQFKEIDETKNQKLLPLMAKSYIEHDNINDIKDVFSTICKKINMGKMELPEKTKKGYIVKDKTFSNWLEFSEYIHGLESMSKGKRKLEDSQIKIETDDKPIFDENGIKIYDADSVGKCIKYTQGGLTGKKYSFCIGQPANTYYKSYRDNETSTFYFIIDENKDLNDPLHIVVFERQRYGVQLWDETNSPGEIAEYGPDDDGYIKYLEEKGVPVDKLLTLREKSSEEIEEEKKLGRQNKDLNWLKDLSYKEKSAYIGRGHILSDEQFKYLWKFKDNDGGFKLLKQYVDMGQPIPEEQFNILISKEENE